MSNTVSPTQPVATVEVWATFTQDPFFYQVGFGRGGFDLLATEPTFLDPRSRLVEPWFPNNQQPGTALGDRVVGVLALQYFSLGGFHPVGTNPLLAWSVTWTTDNFRPRSVDLRTENTPYFALYGLNVPFSVDVVARGAFTPGPGSITVVPAPAAMLGLLSLAAARGRARH